MTDPYTAARPMGIGVLGGSTIVFKRKFRWTLQMEDICGSTVPEHFVKLASRPNLTIEETEINFLNAKTWIPGKAAWETITVTYYDVGGSDDRLEGPANKGLWDWLASVYNFVDNVGLQQGNARDAYAGTARLILYDGCGEPMEEWIMRDAWPQAINFGDLDYSSSEEVTIELTLRYSDVSYKSLCPTFTIERCCVDCNQGGVQKLPADPIFGAI